MKKSIPVLFMAAIIATAIILSACSGAAVAKEGDTVKVLYNGTYDTGELFDSSELHGGEPLQFTIGSAQVIPGFEQAVIGMKVGETKTVHIPSSEAYGPYYPDLILTLNWSQFVEGYEPQVGDQLELTDISGQSAWATVINVSEEGVTVDANHPLAGENLNFEITLVEIL